MALASRFKLSKRRCLTLFVVGLVLLGLGQLSRRVLAVELPRDNLALASLTPGDDFLISRAERSTRDSPAVAYNANLDEYLAVWVNQRGGTDSNIYGQIITGGGIPKGGNFVIRDEGSNSLLYPDVAYDSINQRYLVVWYDLTEFDVEGQLLNEDGSAYGSGFNIATGTADQNYPDVACRSMEPGGGGYLVVWRQTAGNQRDIKGRRLNQTGGLLGGVLDICTQADAQWSPRVAYSPDDDRYLVVWPDDRDSSTQGRNIYGRQVRGGGVLHDEFAISTAGDDQASVAVTYGSGLDGYVVVWKDTRNATTTPDLYGQQVSGTGALVDTVAGNNELLYTGPGAQEYPAVAWGGDGTTGLIAWQDGRAGTSDYHIYGLILTGSTGPTGHTILLPLVTR